MGDLEKRVEELEEFKKFMLEYLPVAMYKADGYNVNDMYKKWLNKEWPFKED